jgi:DNA-binding MurR/RpiR family transcriptional regulator
MANRKSRKATEGIHKLAAAAAADEVGAPESQVLGLEARIHEHYHGMPKSERKIADLILEFPGEVAAYSATELADLAGTSKAAVTRFIRRLQYQSFEEARRAARNAQNWGSPLYLLSRRPETSGFAERVQAHIDQDVQNISVTLQALRPDIFAEIVNAICAARRVYLLGYRNSQHFAAYARSQIIQVRADVHVLPAATGTIVEYIADMTAEDLFLVIGFRRRVAEVTRAVENAAAEGVKIIYVTDWNAGSLPGATWTVPVAVRGNDLFDRYAAAMSFLHFLCVGVVERIGDKGRKRLNRIEKLHGNFHDFD